MKKIFILSLAALALLTACKKDSLTDTTNSFTATIEQSGDKTTLSGNNVHWEADDAISVNGETLTTTGPTGDNLTQATFTSENTVALNGSTPYYKAYYPASYYHDGAMHLPATQDYDATTNGISNLPMYAQSDNHDLVFKNLCGVIALTLKGSNTVSSIEVNSDQQMNGTFTVTYSGNVPSITFSPGQTDATYKKVTLDCGTGVTLNTTTGVTFYIAIPAGSHQLTFRINTTDDYYYTQTTSSTVTVERNYIYPIEWTPAFRLNGQFSVSANKQVNFTKGNLYWDGSAFKFEASQTAYPTSWDASHVGHFYWTKTAANSYASSYSDVTNSTSDHFFADGSDASHMLTVEGQSNLYILSIAEWAYLINTRANHTNLYKSSVTVNGVSGCLIIAPDDYDYTNSPLQSTYNAEAWATAEAAGLVCLPPAGYREGTGFSYQDHSFLLYWSATPDASDAARSYYLDFFNGTCRDQQASAPREHGNPIRLVCTASN